LIGLCRVSTDGQELGLEVQRDMIQTYTAKHGHILVDIFEEHVSGGAEISKRPGLTKPLGAIKSGMGLLVAKRDRLARDSDAAGYLSYVLRNKGVVVLSADSKNGSEPTDKLLRVILDGVGEFEKALIRGRIQAAID